MQDAQRQFVEAAAAALGPKSVVTEHDAIEPWLTDWRGRYRGAAAAILQPASTDEVALIVALANRHDVPLVPQGGNTSMVGGATPPPDGSALILSLRRMNRVRRLAAEEGLVVAEAGVILADLHAAALGQGRRFPLTLGAKGSATIGGLVSTNAGGTQVLRHGTMRGLVLGIEAVLPDGSIHDGLAALKKDNRGYDLNQLLIGAEGTLGVVTAATLRLVPAIAARAVAWVGVDSPHAALDLLHAMAPAADAIESFELIPAHSLDAVLRHIPGTRAPLERPHPWHVLIEAVASNADEAPSALIETLLAQAFERGLVRDAAIAASEAQGEAFWRIRDSISEAERASGPALQHDISVPVAAMPNFMIDGARAVEAAFPGTSAGAFGHLGDGNVHFHVRAPAGSAPDWPTRNAGVISPFVHDLVVAAGGSISAEHGIGQMKRDELARLSSPARMHALNAIKRALDPRNLFNPGKLVSLASDRLDQ
ncbi:FAD-binding oxidoreductase [Sphingomonas turrisvirgatae]|uniref:Hydroxyacid dehydrogenase n=1 Tax=Sphingomonas turrisvirgatae TaxID=1888892 RepID=A0A1E3LYZ0_9SPHN|nr:FAD-binding oxidoreductase [Sphingomonas turrisvirgatae]ODP38996.1 hydroxyacid dehydrogenase [Sphingomonas turrisvirgatae]